MAKIQAGTARRTNKIAEIQYTLVKTLRKYGMNSPEVEGK
jgi:hypothetical protein